MLCLHETPVEAVFSNLFWPGGSRSTHTLNCRGPSCRSILRCTGRSLRFQFSLLTQLAKLAAEGKVVAAMPAIWKACNKPRCDNVPGGAMSAYLRATRSWATLKILP